MGLSLIERYVFRKTIFALLIATGSLVGVVWVVRAIQQIDVVMAKGQGIMTYLQITTFGVPTVAAAILPVALVIATIHALNKLNEDSELVIFNASGASRYALIKPFLLAGLVTAFIVYLLMLWVGPKSMQAVRSFLTEMRADLVAVVIREGAFRDGGKGITFHVASRAPGGILKGIFILDGRDDKETFTYLAEEGAISKVDGQTFLVLKNGQIHRLTAGQDNVSVVKFNSYAYNLSSFSGGAKAAKKAANRTEISTYELFFPDKSAPLYLARPGYYRAELHSRLTSGLYPIATVLIIVAYMGFPQSNRQGQRTAATAAATIAIAIRVAGIIAEGELRSNPIAIVAVWGIPLTGIAVPAIVMAMGRSLGVPDRIVNSMDHVASLAKDGVSNLAQRLSRRGLKNEVSS